MALILDLTGEAGAYGARLLAEMGHEVIRVEPPDGDALRGMAPQIGGLPGTEGSAFHQYLNAGKQSFTPRLDTAQGKRLFLDLVARADAVVASLPLPVAEKEILSARPDLALVCLDDDAPEICAWAQSGLMTITGVPESAPLLMGGHIPNAAIGTYVAMAAESALLARAATGEGQIVDVSAQQCLNSLCEQVAIEYETTGEIMPRRGARGGITAIAGALPCADGHWMVCVPPSQDGWTNFAQLVGDPMFLDDASLQQEAMRREKRDEILDRVAAWSANALRDKLVVDSQEHHVPASPVTTPLDLVGDAGLRERGFLKEINHPQLGAMLMPAGAIAQLRGGVPAASPRLGEHNEAVLARLGIADADRAALLQGACA